MGDAIELETIATLAVDDTVLDPDGELLVSEIDAVTETGDVGDSAVCDTSESELDTALAAFATAETTTVIGVAAHPQLVLFASSTGPVCLTYFTHAGEF